MSRNKVLKQRAAMLRAARQFFFDRSVTEVDCPILSSSASVDAHIDLISTRDNPTRYLHSSPEYGIKRLLAEGLGDCYQISHVFRKKERSHQHNPEFTLVEWYRIGFSFEQLIEETLLFSELFLGPQKKKSITYREAFLHYTNIDPFNASQQQLYDTIMIYTPNPHVTPKSPRDDLLNVLLAVAIEPHLGKDGLTALTHYPASQAALAKTCIQDGANVAERFEVYFQGIELANGYHELTCSKEQQTRFEQANRQRGQEGKETLPIDTHFLKALDHLPDCCGVAVGFDRLLMLQQKASTIDEVLPFHWENA